MNIPSICPTSSTRATRPPTAPSTSPPSRCRCSRRAISSPHRATRRRSLRSSSRSTNTRNTAPAKPQHPTPTQTPQHHRHHTLLPPTPQVKLKSRQALWDASGVGGSSASDANLTVSEETRPNPDPDPNPQSWASDQNLAVRKQITQRKLHDPSPLLSSPLLSSPLLSSPLSCATWQVCKEINQKAYEWALANAGAAARAAFEAHGEPMVMVPRRHSN
jgi:hypothetical protein